MATAPEDADADTAVAEGGEVFALLQEEAVRMAAAADSDEHTATLNAAAEAFVTAAEESGAAGVVAAAPSTLR